jgi:hypothetical protein
MEPLHHPVLHGSIELDSSKNENATVVERAAQHVPRFIVDLGLWIEALDLCAQDGTQVTHVQLLCNRPILKLDCI